MFYLRALLVMRPHNSLRVQAARRQDQGKIPLRNAASRWEENTFRKKGKVKFTPVGTVKAWCGSGFTALQ